MPTKIYQVDESTITWRGTGGTRQISLGATGAGAGQNGELHDFGTAARSRKHKWRAWIKLNAGETPGETVLIYWRTSDGTNPDNDDGTGDVALSNPDKLRNLGPPIGSIQVDENNAAVTFVGKGEITVPHQWGGPTFYNTTTQAFSTPDADHGFDLTPIPDELQD